MSEMRWNPVLSQWVITATHRQDRTFLPPKDHCPLCPTGEGCFPTEVPAPDFEIVCFENRFPTFKRNPSAPSVKGGKLLKVKPSNGICEVVLYTSIHEGSLTDRSIDEIYRLVLVWADRFRELGGRRNINYVFIFENKGEVIGVTLPHPHGQIYAFTYIPPVPKQELNSARKYFDETGKKFKTIFRLWSDQSETKYKTYLLPEFTNLRERHSSSLPIEDITFDQGLKENFFSLSFLVFCNSTNSAKSFSVSGFVLPKFLSKLS